MKTSPVPSSRCGEPTPSCSPSQGRTNNWSLCPFSGCLRTLARNCQVSLGMEKGMPFFQSLVASFLCLHLQFSGMITIIRKRKPLNSKKSVTRKLCYKSMKGQLNHGVTHQKTEIFKCCHLEQRQRYKPVGPVQCPPQPLAIG